MQEADQFEAELRRLAPTAVPPELMKQLRAARSQSQSADMVSPRRIFQWRDWFTAWRGLAVVAPAAAGLVLWLAFRQTAPVETKLSASAGGANAVQVEHSLLAAFDTVAQLPGCEPVRFRCREWQDDVVIHDDVRRVVISQSTPRVEVVPVRFETY